MRSAVLTYHSLDSYGSVISTSPALFRAQMTELVERGIAVVPLEEILNRPRAVALTFDDGYENFAEVAVPVLQQYHLPATVFVVSGMCGGTSGWQGARGLPLMDWSTLRDLPVDLISLGAHSVSHPDLTQLAPEAQGDELRNSRTEIEQRTGRAVCHFAYPYGRTNPALCEAADRVYEMAVATRLDFIPAHPDRMRLPRIDAYYLRRIGTFGAVAEGGAAWYVGLRRWLRALRHGPE